jgi:hypothetical protein
LRLWLADALTPLVPVAVAVAGRLPAFCPADADEDASGGLPPARAESVAAPDGDEALADADVAAVPVT